MENKQTIRKEVSHKISEENRDSLTFGSATKGGAIKVYLDCNEPDKSKKLIDNAIELREYMSAKIEVSFGK